MFGRAESASNQPAPDAALPEIALGDVRIHTMPSALLTARAVLRDERAEALNVPLAVTVPSLPELSQPIVAAEPAVESFEPVGRGRRTIVVAAALLLLLGAGGTVAYFLLVKKAPATDVAVITPVPVTPAPIVTPEPVVQPEPVVPAGPLPGLDTDSDGLSDVEELLYNTNIRNPDTDGDSFLDGNEVFHRYDPTGLAPRTLLQTGTIKEFTNAVFGLTISYPTVWTVTTPAEGGVVFAPASGEASITLTVQPKDPGESLDTWYSRTASLPVRSRGSYVTKEGLSAIGAAEDRLVVLDGGDRAYLIRYDLGTALKIDYLQTFQMMVNSLIKLKS